MAKVKSIDRKDIVICAERLLSQVGVADISLAEIARAMNISKGTLYYHYTSKDDIVFDIMQLHMDSLRADYLQWLDRHPTGLTIDRFLSVVFYKGIKLFDRSKTHLFLINESAKGNTHLSTRFRELLLQWKLILLKGIDLSFDVNTDKEMVCDILLMILDGLVVMEVLGTQNIDTNRLIETLKLLNGGSNR